MTIISNRAKKLFLVDSFGALLSAVLLAGVLAQFEQFIGLPSWILYLLAAIAMIFAAFSLFCFLRVDSNWQSYLHTIAILNISYSGLTIVFLISNWITLTVYGLLYFSIELSLVLLLAYTELKTAIK